MKSARVRPSSFVLVTHMIVVSMHIKYKFHIRHRALCVCVCVNTKGCYTLDLCAYRLRLGFDCFRIING